MRMRLFRFVVTLFAFGGSFVWAQNQADPNQQSVEQRVSEVKETIAANHAKLQKYQWTQITEVSIKGKTRKDEQAQCRYGADGKVLKTSIGPPAEPKQAPGGLKGRLVEKKTAEIKDYMDRLKGLIGHYAPPDPQKIQAARQAGEVTLDRSSPLVTVTIHNYYKQGDQVAFSLDTATKRLTSYNVNTYLDDPKKDVVTLTNEFASLPDGTNYLEQTVLKAQEKQIQIATTNSGYSPAQ